MTNTKRKNYNTIFLRSETWTLKKRQKERLLTLKMDFWRRSARKFEWKESISIFLYEN